MSKFMQNVQLRVKFSFYYMFLLFLRLLSGATLGVTMSVAGSELFGYGEVGFWLIIVAATALFLRASGKWSAWGVLFFDLVCVLLGLLLRMYVLMAPG